MVRVTAASGSTVMKQRWLTITILLAFTAIAVFGFLGMAHGESHVGCVAMTATAATCPSASIPFADLALHVTTWKGFSAATVPSFFVLAIVLLIIAVVIPWERHRFRFVPAEQEPPQPAETTPIGFLLPAFSRWIAIHERRDPPSPRCA